MAYSSFFTCCADRAITVMKNSSFIMHFSSRCLLISWGAGLAVLPVHADQFKANNNSNLELGVSWVSSVAPAGNENAIWNSTVATAANCTNTLGSAVTWGGIVISNPIAPVYISGNTTLTLSNGVNLASAAVNLTVDCSALNLGANQIWTVASGLMLTTGTAGSSGSVNSPNNGNFIVTKSGFGIWTTSGNGDNGSTGIIVNQGTVNLNKSSNSGTHAVGGPGLTVNSGGLAKITGAGGDQIYDAATVTLNSGGTLDLNGNNETIGNLAGTGGVVDNTATGTSATLTVGNSTSTFSGPLQDSGSGAKLGLIKSGTGTLTLSGANSYTGGTTISNGTIALKNGECLDGLHQYDGRHLERDRRQCHHFTADEWLDAWQRHTGADFQPRQLAQHFRSHHQRQRQREHERQRDGERGELGAVRHLHFTAICRKPQRFGQFCGGHRSVGRNDY
jgi:autotransporter-associated beta strand protein